MRQKGTAPVPYTVLKEKYGILICEDFMTKKTHGKDKIWISTGAVNVRSAYNTELNLSSIYLRTVLR